jgi:hypothetical protein
MATLPPDQERPFEASGPPSLSQLPTLTEEVVFDSPLLDVASSIQQLATAAAPIQQATPAPAVPEQPAIPSLFADPVRFQQFLAATVDEAVATAMQQALPRFLAQVRTQVAATVQRRFREEIDKQK